MGAQIQGVDPPSPVRAAENPPSHDRFTHPQTISENIMRIQKCPVTKTESRTVGPKSRLKKSKLGEQINGSWVEVGFCRRSLSDVGSDAQVFRKRWGSSIARGGIATPPSVDSGVFYWYSYCCPGIHFHIAPGRGGDTQYFHSTRQGKEG